MTRPRDVKRYRTWESKLVIPRNGPTSPVGASPAGRDGSAGKTRVKTTSAVLLCPPGFGDSSRAKWPTGCQPVRPIQAGCIGRLE